MRIYSRDELSSLGFRPSIRALSMQNGSFLSNESEGNLKTRTKSKSNEGSEKKKGETGGSSRGINKIKKSTSRRE